MSIQAGDSFFAPWPPPDDNKHLFFVISDPGRNRERVLVVPLMTYDTYKEATCVLEKGEHRFIRHTSYIDYACAVVEAAGFIEQKISAKEFRTHDRASPGLLKKIREGAEKSDFLALGYRDILEEQDLVEPL